MPAFLVILVILSTPVFFSFADGIALGLIVWPILKIVRGRRAEVPTEPLVIAVIIVVYVLTVRIHH